MQLKDSHIEDVSRQDQLLDFANLLTNLQGEPPLNDSSALPGEPLKEFIKSVPLVIRRADSQVAEGALNLLLALIQNDDDLKSFVKALGAEPGFLTSSILTNILNSPILSPPLRAEIHRIYIDALPDSRLSKGLLEDIPSQWLSETERSELALILSRRMDSLGLESEASKVLLRTAAGKAASEENDELIARILSNVDTYVIEERLSAKNQALQELLDVLRGGSLLDYQELSKRQGKELEGKFRLLPSALETKMKYIILGSLGAGRTGEPIPIDEVAKSIQVEDDEVEMWIIDAVRLGVCTAEIDQDDNTVVFRRSLQRQMDSVDWEMLSQRLRQWQRQLSQIATSLRNAGNIGTGPETERSSTRA